VGKNPRTMIDRRTRLEYQVAHPGILSGDVTAEEISGDLNELAARINAKGLLQFNKH